MIDGVIEMSFINISLSNCFQSSQATFHEQHLESALDFGEDFMIDEGDDVDEDINGIQHLFDEWSDGEN